MTHINFELAGRQRGLLRIAPDGSADLDRTIVQTCDYVTGRPLPAWRGYWPVSDAMRDRLLRLPAVRKAIASQAVWARWDEAVSVHGIGRLASEISSAAAGR